MGHPNAWAQKCDWRTGACARCQECLPKCESWCVSHPKPWLVKCAWTTPEGESGACSGCDNCWRRNAAKRSKETGFSASEYQPSKSGNRSSAVVESSADHVSGCV